MRSLRSAARQESLDVIVVDNASSDGSADIAEEACPEVRVFRNAENVGFAKAVNQGATAAAGEYLLLLNPDGYLKPGAIDAIVSFARVNPQYVVCGGRTVTPAGDLDPRSCWAAPSLWSLFCSATLLSALWPGRRFFDPESMGSYLRDEIRAVDIVTGCLFLVAFKDWQRIGGFDERFFVYGEDADFCLRATAETGRHCAITPEAVMVHIVGASSAGRPDKQELLLNGRIALARTHLRGWKGAVGAALIVAGVWVRATLECTGIKKEKVWAEVWERRARWRYGYSASTDSAPGGGRTEKSMVKK